MQMIMMIPDDEISSRLSSVISLNMQSWVHRQVASRLCGVLMPRGLFKIATAVAHLQSVSIGPDHKFSDFPFLEVL